MYVSSTFPEVKAKYIDTGSVYYVFKDFPIVQRHPQAELAAQAAECAGDQGQYWALHEQLFAAPQEWDTTADAAQAAFRRYAETLALDPAELEQCVTQGQHAAEVQQDSAEAQALGLTGTPAFIINGKLLSGAAPTEHFIALLNRELQQR